MSPQIYTVYKATGTSSVTVNGEKDNNVQTYGVIMNQETSGDDTLIYITSLYFNKNLAD